MCNLLIKYQIQSMLSQGKMPVIVGGTNYYIEALVWKFLLDDDKVK